MTLSALDTDHLSLYQVGHPQVLRNLAWHAHHALALTVITVEEELTGWQRALRQASNDARREHIYRRLAETAHAFTGWIILPFPIAAMQRHTALHFPLFFAFWLPRSHEYNARNDTNSQRSLSR